MSRLPLLPKWLLPTPWPSIYDLDSKTPTEMVAKLYGAMSGMIEDYNKFVDEINEEIQTFTSSSTEEIKNFKQSVEQRLKCKFNDLDKQIAKLRLELKKHTDETLEKAFNVFGVTVKTTGETITLTDAADEEIRALSIYGKTTQRWDPVPEYPADLQSVGDSGSVTVKITNGTDEQQITLATPDGLPGIPVSEGGNYTDPTGQSWICDEIDLKRGVYVQRIRKAVFNENNVYHLNQYRLDQGCYVFGCTMLNESVNDSPVISDRLSYKSWYEWNVKDDGNVICYTGNAFFFFLKDQTIDSVEEFTQLLKNKPITVCYILPDPVERPLTAAELAAYKKLHTYMPDTTISNDSGAAMLVEYVAITQNYMENRMQEVTTKTATDIINRKIADGSLAVALQYNPDTEEMNIVTQEV